MTSIGTLVKADSSELTKSVVSAASPVRTPDSVDRIGSTSPTPQISPAGRLQHALSKLTDSLHKLSEPKTWQATKARSSNTELVEASAIQAPAPTQLEVKVEQTAEAQQTSLALSTPLPAAVGLGVLSIEVGKWNDNFQSFTPNPNWPKAAISTGPGDTSINKLRDKINAAGLGVVANVISAPTGNYLILAASSTGQDNGFRITTEPDASLTGEQAQTLKHLEFDPPNNPMGMSLTQAARNAVVKVNGEQIQSSGNFISEIAPGVDLTIKGKGPGTATIRVETDHEYASEVLQSFANAYNNLNDILNQAGSQDAKSYQLAVNARNSVASIWQNESPYQSTRQELERLGLSLDQQGVMRWTQAEATTNDPPSADAPRSMRTIALQLPRDAQDVLSNITVKAPESANTSPLFRQAVIGHYANNMYLEDVN